MASPKSPEQQLAIAAKKADREHEAAKAMREYEAEKARVDANMMRLRELRLAKEATQASTGAKVPIKAVASKPKTAVVAKPKATAAAKKPAAAKPRRKSA